jgi:NADH-quinone oxidoreductase subunit L
VAGMFHLITHAFFKALLFLSAGSVILGMERGQEAAYGHGHGHGRGGNGHDEVSAHGGPAGHDDFDPQDMRNMGGLRSKMPVTFWVYLVGVLAISGIAPLSGFFSKDEILVAASEENLGIFIILVITALLTAFYMGRQFFMIFSGQTRTRAAGAATESRPMVTVPLIILAILSALGGAINLPGSYILEHWLEHTIEVLHPATFVPPLALFALALGIIGLVVAWMIYGRRPAARPQASDPFSERMPMVFKPLSARWWVDAFYHNAIVRGYQSFARILADPVDQGFIDGIVNGFGYLSSAAAQGLRQFQTGFVRSYALVVLFGLVIIMGYLVFFQLR